MSTLIIHARSQQQLDAFVATPAHAVLLTGADGMGKGSVARMLATRVLALTAEQLASHPYVQYVEPEGASIPIETIRQLQHFLRLKTTGTEPLRRAVIIE